MEIKKVIASNVDKKTGKYYGVNCYGDEKVRRFMNEVGENIERFYSDSLSDRPMMALAEKAYLVKGDNLIYWNGEENEKGTNYGEN